MSSSTITVKDGTQIFYKDWGSGQPIVFHHGWPLSADDWDAQMMFFLCAGLPRHRARPARPWTLDADGDRQRDGHLCRRCRRARRAPRSAQCDSYRTLDRRRRSGALRREAWCRARRQGGADRRGAADHGEDGQESRRPAHRSLRRLSRGARWPIARSSFVTCHRARSTASTVPARRCRRASIDNWWRQGMMGGAKAHYDCIKAFSETDFTEDLKTIDVPVLIMHGDDDQIVPDRGLGAAFGQARKEWHAEGLSGPASRHVHDAPRPHQSRPARVRQGSADRYLTAATRRDGLSASDHGRIQINRGLRSLTLGPALQRRGDGSPCGVFAGDHGAGLCRRRSIRPFNVHVPQSALDDLRRRIAATRWPDKETVDDQSQGAQLAKLQAAGSLLGHATTTGGRRKRS